MPAIQSAGTGRRRPGPESDWLAVSSYYFVALTQRMMTREGRTRSLQFDFGPLRYASPVARPADCIYLFGRGTLRAR